MFGELDSPLGNETCHKDAKRFLICKEKPRKIFGVNVNFLY